MPEHLRTLPITEGDLRQLAVEQRLYAVLDACDAPAIQAKVGELGSPRALCLYRGELAPEILEVAPYLVRLDEALLQWLVEAVWSEPWGIFVVAKLEPEAVRKHLRRFLIVKNEIGESMYFRYYDRRVLPAFLGSCRGDELNTLFGPISAFGVGGQETGTSCTFYTVSK